MENSNVLFVDDEKNILNALKRGLIDEEYNCFYANSGEAAIKIMEENNIHVIVTDMKMPKMDGLELLKYVRDNHPDTIKIVLSGYAQLPQIIATINHIDIFKFILKPWKLEDELKVAINEAIKTYNLKYESARLKEELRKKNELYQSILKSTGEKFDIIKNDFKNVRKINDFTNNYIKQIVKKMDGSEAHRIYLLKEINLLEEITRAFLNIFPSKFIDFDIEKLRKELDEYIVTLRGDKNIEIQISEGSNLSYYGNYNLIFLVIKTFIKYILNNIDFKLLKLTLLGKENGETIEFALFAEILDKEKNSNSKLVQASLNKIITILQNLAEAANGKLVLHEKDHSYITILQAIWYNKYQNI
ncbi:response regulator [Paramaledivibacter caminithermalis]|uniref:Stage 0 sporulation protein A homolog n=1 Tax=Paramaledivibacter caminithermalis (strain DSM 15212 / CIP 107654 / DViRD3) TaxID=1121301 RepID=A0A1M6JNV0_PARC5|nr:response regulator [Paramaledivibacter caminithermalis]SHJ48381.1 Response regulator receiver domain-containing protein [Paramaledivibacter caminithermalis DSM 15212]